MAEFDGGTFNGISNDYLGMRATLADAIKQQGAGMTDKTPY